MTIYSGKDLYKIKEGDIVRVTYESGNQSIFRITEVGHNHQSIKGHNLNQYGQFGEGEEIGSLCRFASVEIIETKEQNEAKNKRTAINKKQREQIYNKYNGRCAYCGQKIEYKNMQVDHIKAKYLGGEDKIENYVPACKACNFYKSTLDIKAFKKLIETIPARLNNIFIFRLAVKYGLIEIKDKEVKFLITEE